ncbi:MAG: nucleoside hydrolase [Prolixibacteraceae bacterium]|jgi:inosine-uridine nucleoside N-ribohydrolase|nr:nucleoside hydrolase [Prolixibacteraceae bacterium]
MNKFYVAAVAGMMLTGCQPKTVPSTGGIQKNNVLKMIFETDMGNDVDDALALDMIYKYAEAGKVELLGIMSNKNSKYSAEFIDIMGTWYGHAGIPLGIVKNGIDSVNDAVNYAQVVCEMKENGKPLFERSLADYESLPEAPLLYREILSRQPDSSVTVVSVGFSTNIARLLDTPADEYSPLTGKELVAAKVKLLTVMAGSFGKDSIKEYNIVKDIVSAKKIFDEWPTPIVASPFEVGIKINYPGSSIANDFNWGMMHPVIEAYKAYLPMPYDRPTWDLTAVLYTAEADSAFMTQSGKGIISVTDEGYTRFRPDQEGKHSYLSVTENQADQIKKYFVSLITQKPAKYEVQRKDEK